MLERKTVDQNGRKGHSMATSNAAQKKWERKSPPIEQESLVKEVNRERH